MYIPTGSKTAGDPETPPAPIAAVAPVIRAVPSDALPASYDMTLSADDRSITVRGPKAFLKAVANALVAAGVMTITEEELQRLEE